MRAAAGREASHRTISSSISRRTSGLALRSWNEKWARLRRSAQLTRLVRSIATKWKLVAKGDRVADKRPEFQFVLDELRRERGAVAEFPDILGAVDDDEMASLVAPVTPIADVRIRTPCWRYFSSQPMPSGKVNQDSLDASENRVTPMTTHARENLGVAGRIAICLTAIMLAAASMSGAFAAQDAAANSPPASGDGALPPKANELLTLLAKEWLDKQGVAKSAAPSAAQTSNSFEDYVNSTAGVIHDQIDALARAIPDLPNEFERAAARVTAVDPDSGRGQVLLDLGIFGDRYKVATRRLAAEAQALLNLAVLGAFGVGAQWLFRKMTGRVRRRLDGLSLWRPSRIVCVSSPRVSPLLSARLQPSSSAASALSSPSTGIRSVARWSWAF